MKYLLTTLILLSIGLSNSAYAIEKPKKNSFGDKDHKYRSQYTRSSHKIKTVNPPKNDGNSSPKSPKSDRSKEISDEYLQDKNS